LETISNLPKSRTTESKHIQSSRWETRWAGNPERPRCCRDCLKIMRSGYHESISQKQKLRKWRRATNTCGLCRILSIGDPRCKS